MKYKKKTIKIKYLIIIITIGLLSFYLYNTYQNKVSKKIIELTKIKIEKYLTDVLSNTISYKILNDNNLKDIMILNKNNKGEIIYIDYDLDKAYKSLEIITDNLYEEVKSYETSEIKNLNNAKVIKYPFFISSNNPLLANFGPSIYVKFSPISTMLTNIKTRVTDYGVNNALIELYVILNINEHIITPFMKEEFSLKYEVLISSKVINGRIPSFYGNSFEKNSNILKRSE